MAADDTPIDNDLARRDDPNVAARLEEIAELDLLSAEVQEFLEDIVSEAAERLGLPISLVSIVLDGAQRFAAAHGLEGWLDEVRGTPIEWSFCVNAVRSGLPFIVEDADAHATVRDIPLVEHDDVKCYAGIPLVTSRGVPVGTLCVIGATRRAFAPEELDVLRELAAEAIARIERRAGRSS